MAVLQHHAKPQPRRRFILPTEHDILPSEHISLLSQFLQLAPHLIPPPDPHTVPTLRHPDLSLNNIMLAPGSTKIISIIDWQDAVIFPRLMQAGYPQFCEHDPTQPQGMQMPSLPDDFDKMGIEQQNQCKAVVRMEEANLFYTLATDAGNSQHMEVMRLPNLAMQQYLIHQTGLPWDADLINLRMALVGITTPSVWSEISSAACPVVFSEEERKAAKAESQEWNLSEQLLSQVRDHFGLDLKGGTELDNFERALELNRQARRTFAQQGEEEGLREVAWRNWPLKDDGDDSQPPADI